MSSRGFWSIVGLICSLLAFPALSNSGDGPKTALPASVVKIMGGAQRVECFRISPVTTDTGEGKPSDKQIDGYPVTVIGKEQGRPFAVKLAAVLSDEKSHGPQARCFFPGVGFRFWRAQESVDVVICYGCSNFYVKARDAEGKVIPQSFYAAGFARNWASMVQRAKEAFPDDADVQKLDARDSRGGLPKTGL